MAASVRVGLVDRGQDGWLFRWRDVPWWDAEKLAADDRLREMTLNQSYEDHLGLLICGEAQEIDAASNPLPWWADRVAELREHLARDPWEPIFVWVYSWESGLGG